MKKELVAYLNPKSPVSEIFRTLRTNLQFMNSNKKIKSILVTSTLPGEGKSWVSSNLAITFAQAGQKVVIIDADMRKGRLHNLFEAASKPGLSNYLSGYNEEGIGDDLSYYIRKTEVENLHVIPAGNIPPNPSELLVTEKMINLLEELKSNFDIIIVDGTPSALVTDALILARIIDTTLIVTAHKETKKDNLEQVIRNIKNVGGTIAGVVVNKIPVSVKKYNETYYYASRHDKPKYEYFENRDIQLNRTSDMLMKDRVKKPSGNHEKVERKTQYRDNNFQPKTQHRDNNFQSKAQYRDNSFQPKTHYRDNSFQQNTRRYNDFKANDYSNASKKNNTASPNDMIGQTNDIIQQINKYLEEEKRK